MAWSRTSLKRLALTSLLFMGLVAAMVPLMASTPCPQEASGGGVQLAPHPCRTPTVTDGPTAQSDNLGVWDPSTLECPGDTSFCAGGGRAI